MGSDQLEAVQFREFGAWHAVRPDRDRTFCGRNPIGARRMWERWDDMVDRCQRCQQATQRKGGT